MARTRRGGEAPREETAARACRFAALALESRFAGVLGPGHWLVAEYVPTALFSLKASFATSSVGTSLVVPTPYAIKMALIDAAFRVGLANEECAALLRALVPVEVRIAPPTAAVVTHTFVKIRQEPKTPDPEHPFVSSIAYREVVHFHGRWLWAFDLAAVDVSFGARIVQLTPYVSYVGKRGSFVQFAGLSRQTSLGIEYTQPLPEGGEWKVPPKLHIRPLDDFGPEADLETLSSYTDKKPKRDRHRRFVDSIIPLGLISSGPGFSEYRGQ